MTTTRIEPGVCRCEFEVRATPERVWAALTEASQLEAWFAERAEVEPRVGGAYRFWGKHTPTLGAEGAAGQRITAIEPGRRLAFSWTWGGCATRCEIELEASGGDTAVSIDHSYEGDLHPHLLYDFWALAMGNLDCYLRTGKPALLPDHSGFSENATLSVEIGAPAARVWRLLTEPEQMKRFLGDAMAGEPRVELREGGAYSYGWEQDGKAIGPGVILELKEGRRLVHSWTCDDGVTVTKTAWEVEPLGDERCRLSVRQFGLQDLRDMSGYVNGWGGYLLAMKREAEAA